MEENCVRLSELIRQAQSYVFLDNGDTWYDDDQTKELLFRKFPKLFLPIVKNGEQIPYFVLCNRSGVVDSLIIQKSLDLANSLKDNPEYDQEFLEKQIIRLMKILKKYSKPIPKPTDSAVIKAKMTKNVNKINIYIKNLKESDNQDD